MVEVKCNPQFSNARFKGTMQLNQLLFQLRDTALYMHETLQLAFRNNAMAGMSFSPFKCSETMVVRW